VDGGTIAPVTFELTGKAEALAAGGQVDCLLMGSGVAGLAPALFTRGAGRVLAADHADLKEYRFSPYVRIAADVVRREAPDLVLVPSTFRGKEFAAGLAASLDAGLAVDVTAIEAEGAGVRFVRPCFGGNRTAVVQPLAKPAVAAVRPKAFPPAPSRDGQPGTVVSVPVTVATEEMAAVRILEVIAGGAGEVNLQDAEIVVSGGRG
jgi:electron transfer flavoprotein alpha subunit